MTGVTREGRARTGTESGQPRMKWTSPKLRSAVRKFPLEETDEAKESQIIFILNRKTWVEIIG